MTLNKSVFQRLAVAGALAFGLAASTASAQEGPAAPGAPRAGGQALRAPGQGQRLQRLHDLLQIRPDQEGAFRAFTTALEQARAEREQGRPRGAETQATAPERFDRLAERMAERQQRLKKTAAAAKTFYAVLSPEQRKAFDQLPLIRIGDRHGGRRGGFAGRPSIG